MSKTVRRTSSTSKKESRKMMVTSRKKGGMTMDEFLLKLRVQNLNSGSSEY